MPTTFALLGATGQVGGAVLAALTKDDTVNVRCLVRSKQKLYKQKPQVEGNSRITVIEGSVTDVQALAECIEPSTTVISCTASPGSLPGTSIALDTAHAMVGALTYIRLAKKSTAPLPRIIMLSSSTVNDHLSREVSPAFRWILHNGLRHTYDDLERAEAYYRIHDSWLTVIFMQPGGLVRQESVGHIVNTEKQHTFLPVPDLANAIIEVGKNDSSDLAWKNVSVLAKGKTKFEPNALKALAQGWLWSAFPWLYFILKFFNLY